MKTVNVSFPSKYFAVVFLILLYLIGIQSPIYGQTSMKAKETCAYLDMENFRAGAEISKCSSITNSMEAEQRTNKLSEYGLNFLGDFLMFDKKVALTAGCGFKQSKISISQNNFLSAQKNISKTFDGIDNDPGSYINDQRMYLSLPVRVKWRSKLIGSNKKMFLGSGINYYKLLTQEATLAFERNGVMTDQGKVVEVNAQNQQLDFESQVGVELSLASTLVLHASVVYKKGLISPYTGSNLLLNNIGIQTGVYF